jgi:hypothetical protein
VGCMDFDVTVTHELRLVRVCLSGAAGLGRVLSLLALLEVDGKDWTEPAVLLDLRGVLPPLTDDEQAQVATAAAHALARLERIAILSVTGATREAGGVRAFVSEAEAREWLAAT